MKLTKTLFILLFTALLCACGNNAVRHELQDIESYIQERPDSALASIRAIDTNNLNTRSLKAHYSLLHAMALDKNYIDTTDVRVIRPAIDYYDTHGDNSQKARAYYYLGRIQYNSADYTNSILSFTIALENALLAKDTLYEKMIYGALFALYSHSYDATEALKYALKAYEICKKSGDDIGLWKMTSKLAVCYYNIREYETADSLFNIYMDAPILDTAVYARDILDYAKVCVYKKNPEPEKSIKYFNESRRLEGKPVLEDYYIFAYALLKTNQESAATSLLNKINKIQIPSSLYTAKATWNYKINKILGNYKEALYNLETALNTQDTVIINTLKQSLSKAQKNYFAEKSSKIDYQRKADRLSFALVLALLIFLILAVISFHHKVKQVLKKRIDEIEALNSDIKRQLSENLARELENGQNLTEYRHKYIQAHKKHFQTVNNLCAAYLEPSNKSKQQKIYDEIIESLRSLVDREASPSEAERIVNREFDNVIEKIRKDCPKHGEQTYRLYSFLFMGFSLKTIALILNISPEAVRTSKYRLKEEILLLNTEQKEYYLEYLK